MKTIWIVEYKDGRKWYPCLDWHLTRRDARKWILSRPDRFTYRVVKYGKIDGALLPERRAA